MKLQSISQILDEMDEMEYNKRNSLAYFCAGMLYGLSVLEIDPNARYDVVDEQEETP